MRHDSYTVAWRCSVKKEFLEISQNWQENTCARVCFLIKLQAPACNFIKKETLAQGVFLWILRNSENIFSYRTPLVAASYDFLFIDSYLFLDIYLK